MPLQELLEPSLQVKELSAELPGAIYGNVCWVKPAQGDVDFDLGSRRQVAFTRLSMPLQQIDRRRNCYCDFGRSWHRCGGSESVSQVKTAGGIEYWLASTQLEDAGDLVKK